MTNQEAIEYLKLFHGYDLPIQEALNMAIEALDKPIPKPHDRLMYWETARRIIDSPRSKSQMLTVLDSVPPVEALERKHGEWIERNVTQDRRDAKIPEWQSAKCSVCGKYHTTPYMYYFTNYNYCPNCGANMRGEDDE